MKSESDAEQRSGRSLKVVTRVAGLLYLIIILGGLVGEAVIRNRIIVQDDAAATAANIRSLESLWRAGIAAEFFMLSCTVILALLFFVLLRRVNRDLALLAVFFNLVSVAVEAVNEQQLIAALGPFGEAEYLAAFPPAQLDAMAALSLRSYSYGFGISLIFFGCECVVLGYLIFKSGYLPKAVGVLMAIAGVCYLTNSFALLVSPTLSTLIFPTILIPAFVGEASLCGWLLAKGVNVAKWEAWER